MRGKTNVVDVWRVRPDAVHPAPERGLALVSK